VKREEGDVKHLGISLARPPCEKSRECACLPTCEQSPELCAVDRARVFPYSRDARDPVTRPELAHWPEQAGVMAGILNNANCGDAIPKRMYRDNLRTRSKQFSVLSSWAEPT